MLKKVLLGGALLSQFAAFAQEDRATLTQQPVRHCATPSVDQLPANERAVLEQIERQTSEFIANRATSGSPEAVIVTIPVVVHILYNTAAQNISDAMVQSQIDVLNNDFAKLNADFSKTPAAFQGVAADMQIRFQLATKTPTGAPTNGIIHKYTANSYFEYGRKDAGGVFVKQSAKGGDDAWNTRNYLNMWVCNFGGSAANLLGYATFPSDAGTYKDGVVMGYKYFGVNPALGGVYGYGRTATHEVGHWVNLRHIWGDASCGNDLVSDTPTQQTSNGGCPTLPKRTCGNTTNGDMFMNFMDYTYDQCMYMFSAGQRDRCNALFAAGGARASLLTSTGLSPLAPGTSASLRRHLNVFPNPSEGAATVRLDLPEAAASATLRVLNMQGLPVYERTLSNLAAGMNEAALPHLPRGIYSVQVTGAGTTTQARFSVTQ